MHNMLKRWFFPSSSNDIRGQLLKGHEQAHTKPRPKRMDDRAQPPGEHISERIRGSSLRVAIRCRGTGMSADKCRNAARSAESCHEPVQNHQQQE